jgi:hypothetical protein
MDSELGAIHADAKVTQLGAVNVGVKPPCHLADDAELALTWQHLSAVTIGAKLGAIVIGVKSGAMDLGVKSGAMDLGVEVLEFLMFRILS